MSAVQEKLALSPGKEGKPPLFMSLDQHEIIGITTRLYDLGREVKASEGLIRSLLNALDEAVQHEVPEARAEEMRQLCYKVNLSFPFECLNDYWSDLRRQKPGAVGKLTTEQGAA